MFGDIVTPSPELPYCKSVMPQWWGINDCEGEYEGYHSLYGDHRLFTECEEFPLEYGSCGDGPYKPSCITSCGWVETYTGSTIYEAINFVENGGCTSWGCQCSKSYRIEEDEGVWKVYCCSGVGSENECEDCIDNFSEQRTAWTVRGGMTDYNEACDVCSGAVDKLIYKGNTYYHCAGTIDSTYTWSYFTITGGCSYNAISNPHEDWIISVGYFDDAGCYINCTEKIENTQGPEFSTAITNCSDCEKCVELGVPDREYYESGDLNFYDHEGACSYCTDVEEKDEYAKYTLNGVDYFVCSNVIDDPEFVGGFIYGNHTIGNCNFSLMWYWSINSANKPLWSVWDIEGDVGCGDLEDTNFISVTRISCPKSQEYEPCN